MAFPYAELYENHRRGVCIVQEDYFLKVNRKLNPAMCDWEIRHAQALLSAGKDQE